MKSLEETLGHLTRLAEEVAHPLGLEVVEVKIGQQGRRKTLEVTIFRSSGPVSLSDCEQVSRKLEALLDDSQATGQPLVDGAYLLEVQSPGIERQLKGEKEFRIFKGHKVLVLARNRVGALGTEFTGILAEGEGGKITLLQAQAAGSKQKEVATEAEITLELSDLLKIKLYPDDLAKPKIE